MMLWPDARRRPLQGEPGGQGPIAHRPTAGVRKIPIAMTSPITSAVMAPTLRWRGSR